MIKLTHLNNREFYLNSDLILFIERTPDSLLVLTTGSKIMVKERTDEIIERIIAFKQRIFEGESQLKIICQNRPLSTICDEA